MAKFEKRDEVLELSPIGRRELKEAFEILESIGLYRAAESVAREVAYQVWNNQQNAAREDIPAELRKKFADAAQEWSAGLAEVSLPGHVERFLADAPHFKDGAK